MRACGLAGGAACPCGARYAPPPGDEVLGLLFSHRRVPSCRKHASHTGERRLRLPCVRCLALPGMGRCRCTCSTLFALRGKSASELARRFWSVHGKEFFAGRFAHQETFPARRETGNGAVVHFPAGGDVCHLTGGTRPSPGKIFHIILPPQTRHSTRRASSPTIPRGERRALPAPAQGANPLGIPFWGMATVSPAAPVPQPPQAASPCSWGERASNPSQRHRPAALPPLDFWGVLL